MICLPAESIYCLLIVPLSAQTGCLEIGIYWEKVAKTLKFAFSEAKAIETLAFIANESPGLTPFYVAKVCFYAEKWHFNRYGRPILADTYIAMPRGPVPSTIKNFLDENWDWLEKPQDLDDAVSMDRTQKWVRLFKGKRGPKMEFLSQTDIECLREAMAFCKGKTPDELSQMTHLEKSWCLAEPNRAMDYTNFIDDENPNKEAIIEMAKVDSAYGVL